MRYIQCAALSVFLTLTTYACASPSVEVTWVGLYSVTSSSSVNEPNSVSGTINQSSGIKHISTTKRVPAVLGTRFGFGFVLKDTETKEFKVRYVWRYPAGGLVNPSTGKSASYFEIERTCRVGGPCSNAWSFNHDWELKPGVWVGEVWLGQNLLLSQEFEVYLP
jgi:hypothetical protein